MMSPRRESAGPSRKRSDVPRLSSPPPPTRGHAIAKEVDAMQFSASGSEDGAAEGRPALQTARAKVADGGPARIAALASEITALKLRNMELEAENAKRRSGETAELRSAPPIVIETVLQAPACRPPPLSPQAALLVQAASQIQERLRARRERERARASQIAESAIRESVERQRLSDVARVSGGTGVGI